MTDQDDKWFEDLYSSGDEQTSPSGLDEKIRGSAHRAVRTRYTYWHGIGVAASFVLAVFVYVETIDSPGADHGLVVPSELQEPVRQRAVAPSLSKTGTASAADVVPVISRLDEVTRQLSEQAAMRSESRVAAPQAQSKTGERSFDADILSSPDFADILVNSKEKLESHPGALGISTCGETRFGYCLDVAGRTRIVAPEGTGCDTTVTRDDPVLQTTVIDELPVLRSADNFNRIWVGSTEYACIDGQWQVSGQ
jgi:hypothetical protein